MPDNIWLIALAAIAGLFVGAAAVMAALLFMSGREDEREQWREE